MTPRFDSAKSRLPLSSLLSQMLVAFTIEFDNEFEQRTPHRTTDYGSTSGAKDMPWLVSMAMWALFLRHVPDGGISVREFRQSTGLSVKDLRTWLTRLASWWSYVSIEVAAATKKRGPDSMIRLTPGGAKAVNVWRPLTETIEKRWRKRFGRDQFRDIRDRLGELIDKFQVSLPASLPVPDYGLRVGKMGARKSSAVGHDIYETSLPALISKVLYAFAMEFEGKSAISLAISANILRAIEEQGSEVSELPRLTGVAKAAIVNALGFLEKQGCVRFGPSSSNRRGKTVALTEKGETAKENYIRLAWEIEHDWEFRFGAHTIRSLRRSLEFVVVKSSRELFEGVKLHSGGWRARVEILDSLPHYPMILHRGGFPDGS